MNSFLITCCNATCAVPEAQRELFKGSEELVTSPQGWEPGALNLAQGLAIKLSTPLIHGDVTRLLIDLQEIGDKQWSDISKKIPEPSRTRLGDRLNFKFRHAIEMRLEEDFKRHDAVIHLDIHTAPIEDGKIIFEYSSDPIAEKFASQAAKLIPSQEVDSKHRPLETPTPFIKWMQDQAEGGKLGTVRITVSQSFFMKSIPLRWETIKKDIIKAIINAAQ